MRPGRHRPVRSSRQWLQAILVMQSRQDRRGGDSVPGNNVVPAWARELFGPRVGNAGTETGVWSPVGVKPCHPIHMPADRSCQARRPVASPPEAADSREKLDRSPHAVLGFGSAGPARNAIDISCSGVIKTEIDVDDVMKLAEVPLMESASIGGARMTLVKASALTLEPYRDLRRAN
jgi:hypothetical protein